MARIFYLVAVIAVAAAATITIFPGKININITVATTTTTKTTSDRSSDFSNSTTAAAAAAHSTSSASTAVTVTSFSPSDDVTITPRMSPSIRTDHAGCFSTDLYKNFIDASTTTTDDNWIFGMGRGYAGDPFGSWIQKVGKWKKIGRNVTRPVRYTHLCQRMKSLYNCARKNDDGSVSSASQYEYGDVATDWKLILQGTKSERETCNLWEFASALGGPVGLAEYLLSLSKSSSSRNNNRTRQRHMINVVLNGNSFLRQIFQALACAFEEDITDLWMQKNAQYSVSIAELEKRGISTNKNQVQQNATKIQPSEIGPIVRPPDANMGTCQPNEEISAFYEKGVPLPLKCKDDTGKKQDYDDNIAMVEFGGKIRFYYIFRPFIYANLTEVYHSKLKLDPSEVDMLVFNTGNDKYISQNAKDLLRGFKQTGAWQSKVLWPYEVFKISQLEQILRWFGAVNPRITHAPDAHACMPGVPDDEVNLLMLLLLWQQSKT